MSRKLRLTTFARAMRKQPSRAEKALWSLLRNRQLHGAKFRRQHPIDPYIAYYACVESKLVVEVDGLSHAVDDQIEYDRNRDAAMRAEGWRILRVSEAELLSDSRIALEKVVAALES
jgi:primosomal protein N' (replication factor Y)